MEIKNQSIAAHNIRLLTWFNFFLDFRPYGPIAIIYFAQVTGSFALGLSIFALTSLSASLFEVPTGVLSDKMGRKNTIVTGAIVSTLAITWYAFGQSFWPLVIGAVLEGVAISFFSGNNEALLYDLEVA
jgi:MFS family permease